MDIVERLRICAKYDPDQAEAADEIERLRSQMDLFNPSTTQEMAAAALNFANDEIKRLQERNHVLREENAVLQTELALVRTMLPNVKAYQTGTGDFTPLEEKE